MIRQIARPLLGLPRRRCTSWLEDHWVAMRDGVRLATLHVWPLDVDDAPTILVRTADARAGLRGARLLAARLLAESGYHVLVQEVRGRHESEGHFRPYENEERDGASSLEWAASQPWCNGLIGLLGRGYAGFAGWAALAAAPDKVGAAVFAECTRDVYAAHHPGGALAFEFSLTRAVAMGDRTRPSPRSVDLARGLAFRPAREADRAALRRIDWYRDWVDHPRRDEFWKALVPKLPEVAPPILLLESWRDPCLAAALADYRRLDARGDQQRNAPEIVIGPPSPGRTRFRGRGRRSRRDGFLREAICHFDRHLQMAPVANAPHPRARYFVSGADVLRKAPTWPPPAARTRALHLRDRSPGPGLRAEAPNGAETPDHIRHDPLHESVAGFGAGHALGSGVTTRSAPRAFAYRTDTVTYLSAPLAEPLSIAGEVHAELFVASSSADTDLTARLIDIRAGEEPLGICDGVVRCRWRGSNDDALEPQLLASGEVVSVSIDLGPAAHRFAAGHRVGLEIACCGFPRFDCNPGRQGDPATARATRADASVQQVFHDESRPSRLLLPVIEAP